MLSNSSNNQYQTEMDLSYRTGWVEYFAGLCLWTLVVYGWQRAVSYSTTEDVLHSVTFTAMAVAGNSVFVGFWIWNRLKSFQRGQVPDAAVTLPAVLQGMGK